MASETGHAPNRAYFDRVGALHLNGAALFDSSEVDQSGNLGGVNMPATPVAGVAASYKIARGVHLQIAQSDTVVTGLTTVVSVVICYKSTPTAKQQYALASIGDQAGTPAAGSFLLQTFKSTLAVADDFTDNLSFNWIAVGT